MTAVDTESMTALQELLDERQRYEGWLYALELRRNATAPHVYDRVSTDYTLRLDRVLQRLSERTDQLSESVQGLTSRLTALRSRESDRQDARQEAELRAAVGEYTDDEWSHLREEADHELSHIAEERGGVEIELAELERIIGMVRSPKATATPSPEPEAQTPQPAAASPTEFQSPTSVRPRSMTPTAETPSIDNFVADWSSRREAPTRPAQAEPAAAQTPTPKRESPSSGEMFQAAEPKREPEKTLKCPECGAMNHATEWYCERCGGELATF